MDSRLMPPGCWRMPVVALIKHGDDVHGFFVEAAQAFLQRYHVIMHAEPKSSVCDVLLNLVTVLGGKTARVDKAGFMVLCRIDIDQQRRCLDFGACGCLSIGSAASRLRSAG